jgi:hypothetical protein
MVHINKNELKEEIGKFYNENRDRGKNFTVKHYQRKLPKSSIYRIIKRFEEEGNVKRKCGSGQKRKELSQNQKRALRRLLEGKVGISERWLGRKFNRDHKTIKKDIADMGYERKKRVNAPKVTEKQKITQKKRLNKVVKGSLKATNGLDVIMDDESYYPFDNQYCKDYYVKKGQELPPERKYKRKKKYTEKLLCWIAVSPKGRSEPYFHRSKGAINSKIYKTECIEKRLLPFIKKYYPSGGYIFWSDLASAHYYKETISMFNSLEIRYLPKDENPPNVPQIRPIEDFWASHKKQVYAQGWETGNQDKLIKRFLLKLKNFDQTYLSNLMSRVKTKVRKASDYGVDSLIH